jgi:hypothetical protein
MLVFSTINLFDSSASNDNINKWHTQLDESGNADSVEKPPHLIPPDFRVWETVGKSTTENNGKTFE